MDVNTLAATVVTSFLLPYVKAGVEKIGAKVAESIGEDVGNRIKGAMDTVWNKVKGVFSTDKEKVTFEQFEENPDETSALIEKLLKQKLEGDPAFAKTLADLVEAPSGDGHPSNAQIMNAAIAGIVQMGNFTGNNNTIGGVIMGNLPKNPLE